MVDRSKLEEALTKAKETVADLEQKREAASKEVERLQAAKRPKLEALSTNDRAGQRHLRELNEKIVAERLRLEDFDAAIAEAGARCRAIEAAIHNASRSEAAGDLERLAGEWREVARSADEHAKGLVEAYERCHEIGMEMRRRAYGNTKFNDAFMGPGPRERALHKAGLRRWLPSLGHPLVSERHIAEYAKEIDGAHLDKVIADLRGTAGAEKAEAA